MSKHYAQRDIESLGSLYMQHVEAMTDEELYLKRDIAAELAFRDQQIEELTARVESLSKFKSYVHARLDAAGVPADPDSPHKAEGCRIGGSLDIVLNRQAAADELAEVTSLMIDASFEEATKLEKRGQAALSAYRASRPATEGM